MLDARGIALGGAGRRLFLLPTQPEELRCVRHTITYPSGPGRRPGGRESDASTASAGAALAALRIVTAKRAQHIAHPKGSEPRQEPL